MPTTSQALPVAGGVAGQSAGSQHAQASSLQSQMRAPNMQSPRPPVHVPPFIGSVAGHICIMPPPPVLHSHTIMSASSASQSHSVSP
jgi:hypothetical protein